MAGSVESIPSALDEIEQALDNLNITKQRSTDETVRAAHKLAEASKTDLVIRQGLGGAKPLEQLVALVDCSLNDSLESVEVALRCIGNACIDNNTARENITNLGFLWAIRCLKLPIHGDPVITILTVKVIYNACLDFEPAQKQCFRDNIHYRLIDLLSIGNALQPIDLPLITELLFWICGQKPAQTTEEDLIPDITLWELLGLPRLYLDLLDAEDYAMLVESCLTFVRDGEVQQEVIRCDMMGDLWRVLPSNESKIMKLAANAEDQKLLIPLSTSLIWVLSDISARPEFARRNNLRSEWVTAYLRPVIGAVTVDASPRLMTAAFQVLGNMLWSSEDPSSFSALVVDDRLHLPLFAIMEAFEDLEVLHSAAGLLLQLCQTSTSARATIADVAQSNTALERLCRHENPQLKQDGIKLLRTIGIENPMIQRRFVTLAREVIGDAASAGAAEDTPMIEVP
jgi:hypothetical protein